MFILTCALLASAVLLRRMPLMALAVTLAGLVATSLGPKTEVPASALQVVVACALGLEICYMAATRTRKVSVTGVAIAGAGLPILILELPSPTSLPPERQPGGAHTLRHDRRTPGHDHCLAHRELDPAGAGTDRCLVWIDQQDGYLSIEVTDSGRGGSTTGTSYGITGMRERAALLGGDFSAGPRPGGGFRVAARLPVPAPAR